MHLSLIKVSLLAVFLFSVSGCGTTDFLFGDEGYFRNRSNDYRTAEEVPRIEVPEGLDAAALVDIYVIPPIADNVVPSGKFDLPRPVPLVAAEAESAVRIQKLGDERWMLVAMAPGQLWPQLRGYLSARGIPIVRVDPRQGIMETGWVQTQENALKERYHFRIDEGVQRNTSELHVLHMLQTTAPDAWPEQSVDDEREAQMIADVANYVANRAEIASVSLTAQQAIRAGGRVTLEEDEAGSPFINLQLPYYRAWASLGRALEKTGFVVNDLNRSTGQYFVGLGELADTEDSGWFSSLFSRGSDKEELEYIIKVKAINESTWITIEAEPEVELGKTEMEKLLSLIKGNLS